MSLQREGGGFKKIKSNFLWMSYENGPLSKGDTQKEAIMRSTKAKWRLEVVDSHGHKDDMRRRRR